MIKMFSKWIRNKHWRVNSSLNTRVVSVNFMPGDCSLGVTLTLLFRDQRIQRCLQCNMFRDKGGKAKHGSFKAFTYLCGGIPEADKMKHYLILKLRGEFIHLSLATATPVMISYTE